LKSFPVFFSILLYIVGYAVIFPVDVLALPRITSKGPRDLSHSPVSLTRENYKTYPLSPMKEADIFQRERGHGIYEGDTFEVNPHQKRLFLNPFAYHNKRIDYFVKYFQNDARDHFKVWIDRSHTYIPSIKNIFREYGLPDDLAYLAIIESGFNPKAYSKAKAAGMWQFMAGTAKLYQLRVDWWIDERRDPVKASHAAARHLRDLYEDFDSWPLAITAYNAGKGRVSRAISKYETDDIWEITKRGYLPRETRDYFPKFIAALRILKRPNLYGFAGIIPVEPLDYDEVSVPFATDLKIIAEASDTSVETLKMLNPELRRWFTPPNYSTYRVKIPSGKRETYLNNIARIPLDDRITFLKHTLKKGETLSHISRRYRTSTNAIMYLNDIRNPRRIRAGSVLVIPVRGQKPHIRKAAFTKHQTVIASAKKVTYTVRKGDNIWNIANSFGIRPDFIYRWNGINPGSFIFPGDELVIYVNE
jgi:membrane-bound lytic murein transglycosylase D